MLGSEILVAPVKNKCWTWPVSPYVHLWTGTAYASAAGQRITVKAPRGQPAVFYRKGSPVGARFIANLEAAGISVPSPS